MTTPATASEPNYLCPSCGKGATAQHLGSGDGELVDGRCAICFQCNALLIYEKKAFREISKDEIEAMPADFFLGLTAAQKRVSELRESLRESLVEAAKAAGTQKDFPTAVSDIAKNLHSFGRWAREVSLRPGEACKSPAQQHGWTDLAARLAMLSTMAQLVGDFADDLPEALARVDARENEGDAACAQQ